MTSYRIEVIGTMPDRDEPFTFEYVTEASNAYAAILTLSDEAPAVLLTMDGITVNAHPTTIGHRVAGTDRVV